MTVSALWVAAGVGAYVAYCFYWALVARRLSPISRDFVTGAGTFSAPVFVVVATGLCVNGWMALGHPAMIRAAGLPFAETCCAAIVIPAVGVLLLKRQWVLARSRGHLTQAEMLADYYGSHSLRVLSVVLAVMFAIPFAGMQLGAAGSLVSYASGGAADPRLIGWVLAFGMFLYVCLGGMRGLVFAAALQALLAVTGMIAEGLVAYLHVGGFTGLTALMAKLAAAPKPDSAALFAIPGVIRFVQGVPSGGSGTWTAAMILSYALALAGFQASPGFAQLGFGARSARGFAPQQVWGFAVVIGIVLLFFSVAAGFGARLLPGSGDFAAGPTGFYVHLLGISDPWFGAALAVCALAALQLGAAFFAWTGAVTVTIDLFRRYVSPEAEAGELRLAARIVFACLLLAALLSETFFPRVTAAFGTLALPLATQLIVPLAGLCWYPSITRQGATLGAIAGMLTVVLTEPAGLIVLQALGLHVPWDRWPWTVHSAGWGLALNVATCLLVSVATRGGSERDARHEVQAFLREAAQPSGAVRGPVRGWGWALALVWVFFAIGPGAVIGNRLFLAQADGGPQWVLGLPSLWAWQMLWWAMGVLLIWCLACHLGLSMPPAKHPQFDRERALARLAQHRRPAWISAALDRIVPGRLV